MYDAIIVGARCAGASTALLLARKGYRVLLLDRAIFPSDTMSGHMIHLQGVARLKRWGLGDRLHELDTPPIRQILFDFGNGTLRGEAPAIDNTTEGISPRRYLIDKMLVDAAVAAGVELREEFSVEELLFDGDAVVGVQGRTRQGTIVTEYAHIVIGADGISSKIARLVDAPSYLTVDALTCNYYSYWSGVETEGMEMYARDGRFITAVPTNDDLTIVNVLWPQHQFHNFRSDVEENFLHTLDLAPGLAERVRAGRRVERFTGTAHTQNFLKRPYGPGWALVGDAGFHKDPITAQGMTDAFRDAELLATAINEGLSEGWLMEDALTGYEQRRNEAALPMYQFTCDLARLAPPTTEMRQLLTELLGNQEDTNRFFGTLAGTVSLDEFFAPGNVERMVGERWQQQSALYAGQSLITPSIAA